MAKEIKKYSDWSLFAATPPWEAIKILFSLAVSQGTGWQNDKHQGKKIEAIDVRRAYFYAKAKRNVFIELPEEDLAEEDKQKDLVGLLKMSLYGTRDAANKKRSLSS